MDYTGNPIIPLLAIHEPTLLTGDDNRLQRLLVTVSQP